MKSLPNNKKENTETNRIQIGSQTPIYPDFTTYNGRENNRGRPRFFKTPEVLWDAFVEYTTWVEANPLWSTTYDIRAKQLINVPKKRVMTLIGFCQYVGVNVVYIQQLENMIARNPEGFRHQDFSNVITRIRQAIHLQKIEGTAADFFNPTFMSKWMKLSDKVDVTSGGKELRSMTQQGLTLTQADLDKLSDEELLLLKKVATNLVNKVSGKSTEQTEEDNA